MALMSGAAAFTSGRFSGGPVVESVGCGWEEHYEQTTFRDGPGPVVESVGCYDGPGQSIIELVGRTVRYDQTVSGRGGDEECRDYRSYGPGPVMESVVDDRSNENQNRPPSPTFSDDADSIVDMPSQRPLTPNGRRASGEGAGLGESRDGGAFRRQPRAPRPVGACHTCSPHHPTHYGLCFSTNMYNFKLRCY